MLTNNNNRLHDIANNENLSIDQKDKLARYVELLESWNDRTNLVSKNDIGRIVERHIKESLWFCHSQVIGGSRNIMDLGSGGGFPGIPMKILLPEIQMTLVEAKRIKALFLKEVVSRIQLDGVQVINDRAERLVLMENKVKFELIVSRAVASLKKLWKWSEPLLVENGRLITLKGGILDREIAELQINSQTMIVHMNIYDLVGDDSAKDKKMIIVRKKMA